MRLTKLYENPAKGRLVAVNGRIQTGSYKNKEGNTVYMTDVVANRVEFLKWGDRSQGGAQQSSGSQSEYAMSDSFQAIDEDVPF